MVYRDKGTCIQLIQCKLQSRHGMQEHVFNLYKYAQSSAFNFYNAHFTWYTRICIQLIQLYMVCQFMYSTCTIEVIHVIQYQYTFTSQKLREYKKACSSSEEPEDLVFHEPEEVSVSLISVIHRSIHNLEDVSVLQNYIWGLYPVSSKYWKKSHLAEYS